MKKLVALLVLCMLSLSLGVSPGKVSAAELAGDAAALPLTGETGALESVTTPVEDSVLQYQAYVEGAGWQGLVSSPDFAGTVGASLRLEALLIQWNQPGLGLRYTTHVEDYGWLPEVTEGEISGMPGSGKRVEGLKIELTGEQAAGYDVFYRAHVQNIGWLGWAKNGAAAGSEGLSYRMEAVEILVLPKGDALAPVVSKAFESKYGTPGVNLEVSTAQGGWQQSALQNGAAFPQPLNGLKATLPMTLPSGTVNYSVKPMGSDWLPGVKNGEAMLTPDPLSGVEALRFSLTGNIADNYDLQYRVRVERYGWLGWTTAGNPAGTQGEVLKITGVEVVLVPKGTALPEGTYPPVLVLTPPVVGYTLAAQTKGWLAEVKDGATGGTVGQALALYGFSMKVTVPYKELGIRYSGYFKDKGWSVYAENGQVLDYTKTKNMLEAVKIELTGADAAAYDVYYRAHVQNYGWLDWTKNGMAAGSTTFHYRLEALQVQIVKKGSSVLTEGANAYASPVPLKAIRYSAHVQDVGWMPEVGDGELGGTSGKSLRLEAFTLNLGEQLPSGTVKAAAFIQGIGWRDAANAGSLVGTVGESRRIEEIKVWLEGSIANEYDLYYRVHAAYVGWLDWAKNGEKAGTALYEYRLEAMEIRLVKKGQPAPGKTDKPYAMNIPDNLFTQYMTRNDCYNLDRKIVPKGVMIHSTATPGVMAGEWFSRWNKSYDAGEINRQVAVHAFTDDKSIWQYLPWNHRGWHAGGSANNTHIGIEIAEPGTFYYKGGQMIGYDVAANEAYFRKAWDNTVKLTVMLLRMYDLNENNIIAHYEGYYLGIASGHSDVSHWFPKHGESMDSFRAAVGRALRP